MKTEKKKPVTKKGNGANLGFEEQLFLTADRFARNLNPSNRKHIALAMVFLKHISNTFSAKHAALQGW